MPGMLANSSRNDSHFRTHLAEMGAIGERHIKSKQYFIRTELETKSVFVEYNEALLVEILALKKGSKIESVSPSITLINKL